jgi:predicted permease
MAVLKEEGLVDAGGRRGARIRRALLIGQASAAMVLLVLAGLFILSARRLQAADTGFDTNGLAIAEIDLGRRRLTAAESAPLIRAALERLQTVPGISAAAAASTVPLGIAKDRLQVRVPGVTLLDATKPIGVNFAVVSASYFQTLAIPLLRGTTWSASFAAPSRPSEVVINETMARRLWPSADAIGRLVEVVGQGPLRIVGVARDSIYYRLGEAPLPFMYLPAEAVGLRSFALLFRQPARPANLRALLGRELTAVDARLAPGRVGEFEELREIPLYPLRAIATTSTAFGSLALLLTAVGLYGILSTTVGQRTKEIGVRIALGANPARVLGVIFRDAAVLLAAGAALGLIGAYFAASALAGWFFGVAALEPGIYAMAALVVVSVAAAVSWVPAHRAAAVDPVVALRG